jgi:CubicO group peptidase (beta-lactamase class C family)
MEMVMNLRRGRRRMERVAGTAILAVIVVWPGCGRSDAIAVKRIKAVEKGLVRSVYLKGLAPEKLALAERMDFYRVPGLSVAVIDKNMIEWAKAYGEKDSQTRQPLTTDTLFQGGAFSQLIAGTVVTALEGKGIVGLDENAAAGLRTWRFPPEFESGKIPMTPRNLMAHAANLSDQVLLGYGPDEPIPSLAQMLNGEKPASNGPLWVHPLQRAAAKTRYAEAGYVVLESFLNDRTGRPFEILAREYVFAPGGMPTSTFEVPLPEALRTIAASGHLREGRPIAGLRQSYPAKAAKGLWTTPSEFAGFLLDLLRSAGGGTGRILSAAEARMLFSAQVENFGFGFLVDGARDDIQFKLRGKTHGFACALVLYPVRGQGAVLMTNSDNGFTLIDEILGALSETYQWPHYKPQEKQVLRLDSETFRQFVGRYEVGPNYFLDVTWEDYYLVIQPTGQAATRFYAEGQTLFYSTDPYIQFLRDKGPVDGLVLWQQDFELQAKKLR